MQHSCQDAFSYYSTIEAPVVRDVGEAELSLGALSSHLGQPTACWWRFQPSRQSIGVARQVYECHNRHDYAGGNRNLCTRGEIVTFDLFGLGIERFGCVTGH